jgi:hypothetical protein
MKDVLADARLVVVKVLDEARRGLRHSLAGYLIASRNLADARVFVKYWALTWLSILKLILGVIFRRGPLALIRLLIHYPWIFILLRVNGLMNRLARGRTGIFHESLCLTVHSIAVAVVDQLHDIAYHLERMIINEDLVPSDIAGAMGLKAWIMEIMGIMLPILAPEADLQYIDAAENAGLNPDACSLPKATVGMVLKRHMPEGVAIVSSNMPCDAGAGSYAMLQREYKLPIYRLDAPFHFYNARAEQLFAEDLMAMIAWLEQHTPGRMDWERLKQICAGRNRMLELELELWDMLRAKPAPLAGEAVILSHLWHFNVTPGHPKAVAHYERLVKLARRNVEKGLPATVNERYRAVLWNPPFCHFVDLFSWAERTYGLIMINDSMTYNHHEPIDTSTPETMLKGLSRTILQGPMVRHTRGPAANYLDDIFRMVKQFDLDMVWVANHVGCKAGQAMNGILRERCREKQIPLLILDYDLMDPRIVSHDNMVRQVEFFMDNVMKAPRLDQ